MPLPLSGMCLEVLSICDVYAKYNYIEEWNVDIGYVCSRCNADGIVYKEEYVFFSNSTLVVVVLVTLVVRWYT